MIEFMGKTIHKPLIASSCIATESAGNVSRLIEHGIEGIILKSCADYIRKPADRKRCFSFDRTTGYTYASSPFELEILTLDEEVELLRTLRSEYDVLLITSFTESSIEPQDWISPCQRLQSAGADGIQLDFFYMGNLIGENCFSARAAELLRQLQKSLSVPIMPKLNINLPKDFIMPLLKKAGVEYVSLLDSVRSPCIETADKKAALNMRLDTQTTSCFGAWQLPLTLSYTFTAAQYGFKVCAGGGVVCADDVAKLLTAGALTVQSATFLTKCPTKGKELLSFQ